MAPRRSTLLLATIAIWFAAWAVWTADALVEPVPFAIERAARRLPLCLTGAALCLALGAALSRVRERRPVLLLPVAAAGIAACSLAFALANELVFYVLLPRWGPARLIHIPDVAMMDLWVFLAWTLLFMALTADAERRDRALALARSQAAALDAQHRLLVQQAQPHFLFNALNTIYALVLEDDGARARRGLLALSDYLRRSIDAQDTVVTLAEELRAARDYLAIEQLRFGDRLIVHESVPEPLLESRIPSLILQPLVENCIKHGLAGSPDSVTIAISAYERDGSVVMQVEDDAAPADAARPGAGIGLASVRRRLEASYGQAARLDAAATARGFRATLWIPTEL
ncbi:sensor histidine kinase [Sphingomonas sp.]|uniref:sensor histidine kinase n=1 Tax=Sphingomonas sp. TaxID=28214 RepID=UPI002DB8E002|nr:histidine kinase [Sphingomonas sp.]HEU4967558.1 histidine kinase [Sphingomonas sp.]